MKRFGLLVAIMLAVSSLPALAQTKNSKVGVLRCTFGTSVGLIIGSVQNMTCVFTRSGRHRENYTARFTRIGLDVGIRGAGRLSWAVLTTNPRGLPPRALAGNYVGAAADASLGVGAGANALIGGWNNSITLQPVSVSGQVGVNLALAAANFRLE